MIVNIVYNDNSVVDV